MKRRNTRQTKNGKGGQDPYRLIGILLQIISIAIQIYVITHS